MERVGVAAAFNSSPERCTFLGSVGCGVEGRGWLCLAKTISIILPSRGRRLCCFHHSGFFEGTDTSTCDIVQLSAISGNRTFNVYLLPRCTMTDGAARVTGLTVDRQSLLFRGRPVQTVPHRQALRDFISFLKTFNRPFLVGHNSSRFDWPILTRVLADYYLLEEWGGVVSGCVDTLGLSREMFRLHKYSQQFLVQHFLQQSYGAHDASEDVRTLQDLYRVWNPPEELVKKHKISTAFLHYH